MNEDSREDPIVALIRDNYVDKIFGDLLSRSDSESEFDESKREKIRRSLLQYGGTLGELFRLFFDRLCVEIAEQSIKVMNGENDEFTVTIGNRAYGVSGSGSVAAHRAEVKWEEAEDGTSEEEA